MWKTKCRSRSDVEFFMGGDDSDWDHLRCIYGQNTGDYGRCPGLIQGGGDTLHYDDRRHGILDGIDVNCVEGRDD